MRDLRNLPKQVVERMRSCDALGEIGLHVGRQLVEGGTGQRGRHDAQRLTVRAVDDAETSVRTLDGYATVYDSAYPIGGGKDSAWGWDETIVAGAARKSVEERDDVFLLNDHVGLSIASTKSGSLTLTSDKVGLLSVATPDMRSQWNQEVLLRVDSGDLDSMSFAFQVLRQEWNADYTERYITELKLFDVSVVKWPANPATHVHSRAAATRGVGVDAVEHEIELLKLRRFAA
jgi:uncharacterized protein